MLPCYSFLGQFGFWAWLKERNCIKKGVQVVEGVEREEWLEGGIARRDKRDVSESRVGYSKSERDLERRKAGREE